MSIGLIVVGLIEAVIMLIILWCLLSWFPNIKWYQQPFRTLDQLVQPFVLPIRRFIPPLGGIDISPMITIFILQFIAQLARQFLL